jgi:hypothetical protein
MIYFSCFNEKVPLVSDSMKGTEGIPSHLATVVCQKLVLFANIILTDRSRKYETYY